MKAIPDTHVLQTIRAYFEGLGGEKPEPWLELFAEDAASHDPVGVPAAEGRREIRRQWEALKAPFDWLTVQPDETFYGGTGAAMRWTGRGLGRNRREVVFHGITVLELNAEGTIQTAMAYWDPTEMMIELAGESEES